MSRPSPTPRPSLDALPFRRQFLLSTEANHSLPDSKKILVGGRYHLSVHEDLELTHLERDGRSLTLLGFMLDPDRPEHANDKILRRLIEQAELIAELPDATATLGGRWALVAHDPADTVIFNDATGQRQVYYSHDPASARMVCASESGTIAEQLGLSMDPDAVDFIQSRKTDDSEIYWLPGDTSLFSTIKALLPNHTLCLQHGTCRRFWPVEAPAEINHAQALAECVRILKGQVASARLRHPLSVPMTAGWDSRLMLSLNREHADGLHSFTLVYPHLPLKSRDVAVPARLLPQLGIDHHVIHYPQDIDEEFKAIFRRNNVSANTAYCGDIQALHTHYPAERVCVTGDAAEIVKCHYERKLPDSVPVSASDLAEFSRLGSHPFVIRAFNRWLDQAGSPPPPLLDLFCWEQMAGRWQAKVRAEYDMVQESFSPLNNRHLLGIMLAVDPALRRAPDFGFFRELVMALWPEVLCEPVNPPEHVSYKRRVLNIVKRTGILNLLPASMLKRAKALVR
jgi:hypothetical protein